MGLRSLACEGEVIFYYNIPLVSEQGRLYADPKVVAVVGTCIFQARDAINENHGKVIKIDSQLDPKIMTGSGPIDYQLE